MVGLGCFTEYIICRRRSCGAIASLCLGVPHTYILPSPGQWLPDTVDRAKALGESCLVKEFGERNAGDTYVV
jgi:hypothetical protein